ncbi:MAG: hypothetical protein U1C74_23510 [Phenylobacterium sp.]|nr:hypothetical protein [Phenylobacterium sp.]
MAAADETTHALLSSDDELVAAIWAFDDYCRERLWANADVDAVALVLMMNAYQMYLAGVRTALGGHTTAVFPQLRTALESAAYGGLIVAQPELAGTWTSRHQSDAARKACRDHFTFAKAIKPLKARAPSIHDLSNDAYDNAIDFGAHPNIKGVFGHVTVDEDRPDGFYGVNHTSLYGPGHIETVRGLCACLDFGLAIISIIALSLPMPDDQIAEDLQRLSDAKNAATAPYDRPPEEV